MTDQDPRALIEHERRILTVDNQSFVPMRSYNKIATALLAALDERDALRRAAAKARVSLEHAINIIENFVPDDALGFDSEGDYDVPDSVRTWPIKAEHLHYMRESAAALAQGQREGG